METNATSHASSLAPSWTDQDRQAQIDTTKAQIIAAGRVVVAELDVRKPGAGPSFPEVWYRIEIEAVGKDGKTVRALANLYTDGKTKLHVL